MTKLGLVVLVFLGGCAFYDGDDDQAPTADAGAPDAELELDAGPTSTLCSDVCDGPWYCDANECRCDTLPNVCDAPCSICEPDWPGHVCEADGTCACDTQEPLGPHIECTAE